MPDERTDPPRSEGEMIAATVAVIRDRIPPTWDVRVRKPEMSERDLRIDAEVAFVAPNGLVVTMLAEVKNIFRAQDVDPLCRQLARATERFPGTTGLLIARHLSASTRQRLIDADISFVDATGNLYIRADRSALFLSATGATVDPWRGPGRPPASLKGEPAAKVVRALLDYRGPWRTRELIRAAEVATGSAYRVLDFLAREALITREQQGVIEVPQWEALLRRWSQDYQFLEDNMVTRWIAPRGLPTLLDRIRSSEFADYAITGSVAASGWAPYAPPRSAMIYAVDPESAAAAWDLRSTDKGANVLVAAPVYPVLLARSRTTADGLRVAAPTQVAVDLMNGPGRAPAEAQELINWMGSNEQTWRHR